MQSRAEDIRQLLEQRDIEVALLRTELASCSEHADATLEGVLARLYDWNACAQFEMALIVRSVSGSFGMAELTEQQLKGLVADMEAASGAPPTSALIADIREKVDAAYDISTMSTRECKLVMLVTVTLVTRSVLTCCMHCSCAGEYIFKVPDHFWHPVPGFLERDSSTYR